MLDPNWIMAIIAIAAILSPAIVSIIDNIFKYKSKQIELSYPKQREALSHFVSCAMQYYAGGSFKYTTDYMTAKNNLYVYFLNVPTEELNKLDVLSNSNNFDEYKNCVNQIAIKLSQQTHK